MTAINTNYHPTLSANVKPQTASFSPSVQSSNTEDEKAQMVAALLDQSNKSIEFDQRFKEVANNLKGFWEKYSPDLILTPNNPKDPETEKTLVVDRNGNVVDVNQLWSDWISQRRVSSTTI